MGSTFRTLRGRLVAAVATCAALAACGDGGVGPDTGSLSLVVVWGGDQVGVEGRLLSRPVAVRLRDAAGSPVVGKWVRFTVVEGGGEALDDASVTGAGGVVDTPWRLGTAGPQRMRVAVDGGETEVVVEAIAVRVADADVLVIRGTGGGVRGVLLLREMPEGLEILREEAGSDTIFLLPPMDAPGVKILVFPSEHRPLQLSPGWTPNPDTVVLHPQPPLPVSLRISVRHGDFSSVKRAMENALELTERHWRSSGLGLVLGEVTWEDAVEPGAVVDVRSGGCQTRVGDGVIQVTVVGTVDGSNGGYACPEGYVWIASSGVSYPYLVAHELGHTFSLMHTPAGLMSPRNPGAGLADGEIYRAHFNTISVLNHAMGAQPAAERRNCGASLLVHTAQCLPLDFILGEALY